MNAGKLEPDVAAAFEALPKNFAEALLPIRAEIFRVATEEGVDPLDESLKWGQPAYRPRAPRTGTTLRLGQHAGRPALFVPCSTTLVDGYRRDLPEAFDYEGDRAILLREVVDADALGIVIARALTYHRRFFA